MELKQLLKKLCETSAVSGTECELTSTLSDIVGEYGTVTTDALGNLTVHKSGEGMHFLLDAHMDQIGLIVTGIGKDGFLSVDKVGGVDLRTLCGAEVTVWGSEPLYGVICSKPPHLIESGESDKAVKLKDIAVDIGMSYDEAVEKVSLGDRISFKNSFGELLNGEVTSVSVDNRAGMCAVIRALEILNEQNSDSEITANFTVQEETGGAGAGPASFMSGADYALVTDVSFAKAPGIADTECSPMGSGAMICYAPGLDTQMSRELEETAKEKGIPHTLEICSGSTGTNADKILSAGKGTKTALVSIPIKNMHTPVETVKLSDIEATAQVMANFILKKEGKI